VRVILFDVGQGFCCFLKSATGATLMIDCSGSAKFSPVKYIKEHELGGVAPINGKFLTKLIVTHPHDDHIKDISRVIEELPPYLLLRGLYNWEDVKSPDKSADDYESLDTFAAWQAQYTAVPVYAPNWGRMSIEHFRVPQIILPNTNNGKAVNNSSFAVIVTFTGTVYTHKFLFGGDLEQSGWEALLRQNAAFRTAVKGTTFYFASHHGHISGFSTELFTAMGGQPFLNLISATTCYDSHDSRYSANARGLYFGQEQRFTLTTRTDGSIFIDVNDAGVATVSAYHLADNLEPEVPDYLSEFLKSFNATSGRG
jgi:beta-lactamase superfamily II metal-dependent hydrolase